MATNPMKKKFRSGLIIGILITFIIAAIIIAFLIMQIQEQQEEIDTYNQGLVNVYTLNQNVQSGQALTSDMFTLSTVSSTTVPTNATGDITTTLSSYSLSDDVGHNIYVASDDDGNTLYTDGEYELKKYESDSVVYYVDVNDDNNKTIILNGKYADDLDNEEKAGQTAGTITTYYQVEVDGNQYTIYTVDSEGSEIIATSLEAGEEVYYYETQSEDEGEIIQTEETEETKEVITIMSNIVVAKVDMNANTVITSSLVARSDEKTTDDLRTMEYNVITLPTELMTGDVVDIRFLLPNGQDYIVVAKKEVTVPMANGSYLTDTIQMNLTEKEILYMSCAIVECFQIEGSKLYVSIYTEAGLQEEAEITYYPNNDVINLVQSDDNVLDDAIEGIKDRRSQINEELNAIDEETASELITSEMEESIESSEEARQNYLQGLTSGE